MRPPYEPQNSLIRSALRTAGWIVLPVGIVLAAIGLVSFFSAFSGGGPPTNFWCAMVGLPLIGIGAACLKAGYLRTIATYVAGESTPAVADAARAVAKQWRAGANEADTDASADEKADVARRMRQLESLKDSGLISDDEYCVKRAEILKAL